MMSTSETTKRHKTKLATKRHQKHKMSKKLFCAFCASLWLIVICGGCRRDMQDQPKMKPMRSTSFFGDGLSSLQPIEGTVPRGFLRSETAYFTGKKSGTPTASPTPGTAQPGNAQ